MRSVGNTWVPRPLVDLGPGTPAGRAIFGRAKARELTAPRTLQVRDATQTPPGGRTGHSMMEDHDQIASSGARISLPLTALGPRAQARVGSKQDSGHH